jgi:hypothetical protein
MATFTARVTATGIDAGGYIFENVFYVNGEFTTQTMYEIATAVEDYLADPFFATYVEALPNVVKLLTISVATVLPDAGITFVANVNEFGARDVSQASGTLALGFRIVPDDGVPPVGHQYVPCLGDGDVEADVVVDNAAFDALKAAYGALCSPGGLLNCQLAIWNKATSTGRGAAAVDQMVKPVVLSKRQRA